MWFALCRSKRRLAPIRSCQVDTRVPTCGWNKNTTLVMQIICNGVGVSIGSGKLFLRMTRDALATPDEAAGRRSEVVRCRLISEVRVSSVLDNRSGTSGFYSVDIFRSPGRSAEPVVFSRATLTPDHHSDGRDAVKSKIDSRECLRCLEKSRGEELPSPSKQAATPEYVCRLKHSRQASITISTHFPKARKW